MLTIQFFFENMQIIGPIMSFVKTFLFYSNDQQVISVIKIFKGFVYD